MRLDGWNQVRKMLLWLGVIMRSTRVRPMHLQNCA